MTDPLLPTFVATASAATLALFGVDYYSLLWGFVGAMWAVMEAEREPWLRAIVLVALSTLLGAAFGSAAQLLVEPPSRGVLIIGALLGGAGAKLIVSTAIRSVVARIGSLGGAGGGP